MTAIRQRERLPPTAHDRYLHAVLGTPLPVRYGPPKLVGFQPKNSQELWQPGSLPEARPSRLKSVSWPCGCSGLVDQRGQVTSINRCHKGKLCDLNTD